MGLTLLHPSEPMQVDISSPSEISVMKGNFFKKHKVNRTKRFSLSSFEDERAALPDLAKLSGPICAKE